MGSGAAGRGSTLFIVDNCGPGDALRIKGLIESAGKAAEHVTLLAGDNAFEALADTTHVDRIVRSRLYGASERPGVVGLLGKTREIIRLCRQLDGPYSQAIVFLWGSTFLNLLSLLVSRRRIGYRHRVRWLLSDDLGPYAATPDVAQCLRLLRAAGIEPSRAPAESSHDLAADREYVSGLLRGFEHPNQGPLIVLHGGSDWACQQWEAHRWASVVNELVARYRARLVMTGTTADADHLAEIRAGIEGQPAYLVGRTNLAQLRELLRRADLCLCVDSATYELARQVGVPTVVIAGPTSVEPEPAERPYVTVLNRTAVELRESITACQDSKTPAHRCQLWSCPMAGLRSIEVPDVLAAIEEHGHLERRPPAESHPTAPPAGLPDSR